MSLNTIPGLGKSGMSRMWSRRSPALTWRSAQIAHEQQVLEVRGDRGEVLERLDRLLAPLGIARAQRRGEDLLQQRGLALGRGAEHAQVAARHAVAGQLGDGAHDLALGLVVVLRDCPARPALLALDDPVVLELGDQLGVGAGLLDDVLERVQRAAGADRERQPPQRRARAGVAGRRAAGLGLPRTGLGRAAGGELLADHPQRQELVALQAQDRAQARDVGGGVEPVAAGRAPRREQLLVLQVADLGDRDVGELLRERLADGADRQGLAGALRRRVRADGRAPSPPGGAAVGAGSSAI